MANKRRSLIVFFAGAGITLLIAGLLPFIALAQEGTAEPSPEATPEATPTGFYNLENAPVIEATGNNSYCIVCHTQPLHTVTLQDGNILNLYVNPETIANSVHGVNNPAGRLGCVDCHGENSFPHSGATPTDHRAYTLRSVQFCINCHADEADALQHGLHEQAILRGNTQAAVCTDCHGAHNIQEVARFPELVAGVCGECHETTLAEWRSSLHVDIGPLDCATCHSPHSQQIRTGTNSNELCLNCHKEMPAIFSHNQHVVENSTVQCVNCHMFVAPEDSTQVVSNSPVPLGATGHTMQVQTLACNTCHQDMVDSGKWAQIVGDIETVRAERDALQQRVSELETVQVSEGAPQDTTFLQLVQGLILGIGFGITIAAVFIARGNRQSASAASSSEAAGGGESHE